MHNVDVANSKIHYTHSWLRGCLARTANRLEERGGGEKEREGGNISRKFGSFWNSHEKHSWVSSIVSLVLQTGSCYPGYWHLCRGRLIEYSVRSLQRPPLKKRLGTRQSEGLCNALSVVQIRTSLQGTKTSRLPSCHNLCQPEIWWSLTVLFVSDTTPFLWGGGGVQELLDLCVIMWL